MKLLSLTADQAPSAHQAEALRLLFEILNRFAPALDLHSATRVALSCKALRDAGEARIWSAIDLISPANLDATRTLDSVHGAKLQASIDRLFFVHECTTSYPLRAECVTTLLFPSLPAPHHPTLFRLLDAVQPQLVNLGISLDVSTSVNKRAAGRATDPGLRFSPRPTPELAHIIDSFSAWPKLRALRFATNIYADIPLFLTLLGKCPAMTSLEWHWSSPHATVNDIFWRQLKEDQIPALPSLRYLSIMHQARFSLVLKLLKRATNLEDVTFRGIGQRDSKGRASGPRALFVQMKKMPQLETLSWFTSDPIEEVQEHARYLQHVETVAITAPDRSGEVLSSVLCALPRSTHAGRLVLVTTPDPAYTFNKKNDRCVTSYIALEHRITHSIPTRLAVLLDQHRQLSEILYLPFGPALARPDMYRPPWTGAPETLSPTETVLGFAETYLPAGRWEAESMSGVVVRTCTTGWRHVDFILARALARPESSRSEDLEPHWTHEADPGVVEREWHEFTSYKGWCVPYEVVLRVYELAAISPDWGMAARDIHIPEEAWRVLDRWYTMVSAQEVGTVDA